MIIDSPRSSRYCLQCLTLNFRLIHLNVMLFLHNYTKFKQCDISIYFSFVASIYPQVNKCLLVSMSVCLIWNNLQQVFSFWSTKHIMSVYDSLTFHKLIHQPMSNNLTYI